MGFRYTAARMVSAASTWGLKNVFHRPAANFPGKIALYVDPAVIGHAKGKLRHGSVAVVGTNGKTTVTNLLADVLEQAGFSTICNRTGANLDSGVATALLSGNAADWGVFESDELWLAKIMPQLKPNYVLLLNLFRDQLDRCGEIDRIQDSIVGALASSPKTVLVYNADDPLCATIAKRASELPGREGVSSVAFGVQKSMGLAQNTVTDATICQFCSSMFTYQWRQYGQLGEYECPSCHFSRPPLDYAAEQVKLSPEGLSFEIVSKRAHEPKGRDENGDDSQPKLTQVQAPFTGAYMVYNLLAVGVMAQLLGCSPTALTKAIDAFDPQNGRLQSYVIGGRRVLLNLAKNPTGFNQNLKIVNLDEGHPAVAFFINDKEADGHDVSWLWDIDFEELSENAPCQVYAGGIRGADMAVRLKYADIAAEQVLSPSALLDSLAKLPREVNAYIIANYTALPGVKAALDAAAEADKGATPAEGATQGSLGGETGQGEVEGGMDKGTAQGKAEGEGVAGEKVLRDAGEGETADQASAGSAAEVAIEQGTRRTDEGSSETLAQRTAPGVDHCIATETQPGTTPIRIAHLFPDLLNLYGDGGNVRVLEQRLRWRGIPVDVVRVNHDDPIDFTTVDLVMMGGSPDREQRLASADLLTMADDLRAYVDSGAPLLAICGSYQMLGRQWLLDGEEVPGLSIIPMTTGRPGTSADRLTSNIILESPLVTTPVVGYENHAGRTYLDDGVQSFGRVVSTEGLGNNEQSHEDGVLYKGVIGTYLHGPLLAKNPQVADELLNRALSRHSARTGESLLTLTPLDDGPEIAANEQLCTRFVK